MNNQKQLKINSEAEGWGMGPLDVMADMWSRTS